jgi:tetratricopeptide (TPR) repeat protein
MSAAHFIGVYSTTARRHSGGASRKRYWFVWEIPGGDHVVQLLDAAYKPGDAPVSITKMEFSNRFRLETSIYVTPPGDLDISGLSTRSAERGSDIFGDEEPSGKGEPDRKAHAAAAEAAQRMLEAARLDQSLRDDFAVALAKLRRGDKAGALNMLDKLASRREGIVPAHKHTFTAFAVNLRKQQLLATAFKFYQRVLELSPEDSYAYFNMARIMFELGDYDGTEKHLQQALHLDLDFIEAQRFLDYLARQRIASRGDVSAGGPRPEAAGLTTK